VAAAVALGFNRMNGLRQAEWRISGQSGDGRAVNQSYALPSLRRWLFIGIGFIISGCATGPLDYTKGQSPVCQVHNTAMMKKLVPAHYGLQSVDKRKEARLKAAAQLFPHVAEDVNPGCNRSGPKSAVVYSCAECERASREWELRYDVHH
jgi:hypothetical protein